MLIQLLNSLSLWLIFSPVDKERLSLVVVLLGGLGHVCLVVMAVGNVVSDLVLLPESLVESVSQIVLGIEMRASLT